MVEETKKKRNGLGSNETEKLNGDGKVQNGGANGEEEVELSEEDRALMEKLELLVERAQDKEDGVRKLALEQIRSEIRSATSSMTSVPKPLKFLKPSFKPLKKFWFDGHRTGDTGRLMADVLSVMSMTMSENPDARECLRFKLAGQMDGVDTWGHEYVRFLAGEIGREYAELSVQVEDGVDGKDEDTPFDKVSIEDLKNLVNQIVPFLMKSNAEAEATDLVTEMQMLEILREHTDEHNFSRVCIYLESIAPFFPEPEDRAIFSAACIIYSEHKKPSHALRVALRISDVDLISSVLDPAPDSPLVLTPATRKQLALDLGAACHFPRQGDEDFFASVPGLDEKTTEILESLVHNRSLSKYYLHLAKELQVLEPKHPTDIYKMHLVEGNVGLSASNAAASDSARANMASTYVNAFVNAGFGTDRLMMVDSVADGGSGEGKQAASGTEWVYRNKDHGMMAASASLGLIQLWDFENGISHIDRFMYAEEEYVRAGAFLAIGVVTARVRHPFDPAIAILSEHVKKSIEGPGEKISLVEKIAAVAALGIAYAGTDSEDCKDLLKDFVCNREQPGDLAAIAALSLGLISIGTADENLSTLLVQALSDRTDAKKDEAKGLTNILLPLGLALLYMGKGEEVDVMMETVIAMCRDSSEEGGNEELGRIAPIVLESCAYAGSGNVLKVQKMLGIAGRHVSTSKESKDGEGTQRENSNERGEIDASSSNGTIGSNGSEAVQRNANGPTGSPSENGVSDDKETKEDSGETGAAEQASAVLGLAMIAMGEELGAEMVQRAFGHLLQYGDPAVRKTVPIAIGLVSVSNPQIALMELLSKLSHDSDTQVAQNAIFSLGLIGAGTNNSRVAALLRQLSAYYGKDPAALFLVRLAQGLLHAGKGLVTLSPYQADGKGLLNKIGLAGLLIVLYSALDMKSTILTKNHFLLYFLALSIHPRMLFTVDEQGEFLPVTVRVGQAVDTVGQAGRPKRITGFQTHTTPVLLAANERAELGTSEYVALSAILEDVVILVKNEDHVEVDLEKIVKNREKARAESSKEADGNLSTGGASEAT